MAYALERTVQDGENAYTVLAGDSDEAHVALVVDGKIHWLSHGALDELLDALAEGKRSLKSASLT